MNKLAILLLLFSTTAYCQVKNSNLKVLQFEGTDSTKIQTVNEVRYNDNGQIKFEKFSGFKTSKYNSFTDVEITNFYRDTLLIKTLKYYTNSVDPDSARIEYQYNRKNQLVQRKYFDYKKRLKKELEFGDCLIDSTDYELTPTWKLYSKINFKYDSQGRKIEYYASELHWDSQNHYLYEYDTQGNLIKETSFNHDELIWEKYFDYSINGYDYFYNREQGKKIKSKSDWPYFYEVRYLKDKNGNIIEESKTRKNGTLDYRIKREYNRNRIIKEQRFNSKDKLELTKIYRYK